MEFDLFDGGDDVEHNGIGLVEISKIFVMQDDFFSQGGTIWNSIAPGTKCTHECLLYEQAHAAQSIENKTLSKE